MKRLIGMLAVAGVVAVSGFCTTAMADDAAAGAGAAKHKDGVKHERPELADMTVTGVLTKDSKTLKDGKTVDVFTLTDAAGNKVMLGGEHQKAGAADVSAKLADFVGKTVTVTGKGFKREHDGKTMTRIVEVTTVEAAAAAAAAPAAPVAPAK